MTDNFTIDYERVQQQDEYLTRKLNELEQFVSRICFQNGSADLIAFVGSLINNANNDPQQVYDDLQQAITALQQIQDHLPRMITLRDKQRMTSTLLQHFSIVAANLGDFSQETDTAINNILQSGKDG